MFICVFISLLFNISSFKVLALLRQLNFPLWDKYLHYLILHPHNKIRLCIMKMVAAKISYLLSKFV